jgi:hypothetical protein
VGKYPIARTNAPVTSRGASIRGWLPSPHPVLAGLPHRDHHHHLPLSPFSLYAAARGRDTGYRGPFSHRISSFSLFSPFFSDSRGRHWSHPDPGHDPIRSLNTQCPFPGEKNFKRRNDGDGSSRDGAGELGGASRVFNNIGHGHSCCTRGDGKMTMWIGLPLDILYTDRLKHVKSVARTHDAPWYLRVPVAFLDVLHVMNEQQLRRHVGYSSGVLALLII